MYNIEKMVDAIVLQVKVICEIMGIDPTPMPNEDGYVAPTIEELTDPDA
jgi:hydrogenase maturation factor